MQPERLKALAGLFPDYQLTWDEATQTLSFTPIETLLPPELDD